MNFLKLSELSNLSDEAVDRSIFITLDIDWAPDFVLEKVLEMIESHNLPVTWFVTHATPLLSRMKSNPNMELGIHPNFNPLLLGQTTSDIKSFRDSIDNVMELVPDAKCVRSHSLVQAPCINQHCINNGVTIDSSLFVPAFKNKAPISSFEDFSGMRKAPFFWGDYASFSDENNSLAASFIMRKGLKIFNFHPIHLYLNSDNLMRYEQSKKVNKSEVEYAKLINNSNGINNQFLSLIKTVN